MRRKNSSLSLRILFAFSSMALVMSFFAILIAGFTLWWSATIAVSICCLAVPVILGGGAVLEIVVGILEAFVEGVLAIFEGIGSLLGNIFS